MNYGQLESGEWFSFSGRTLYISCCDCGLVHIVNMRILKGGKVISMNFVRDEKETKKQRNYSSKKK
jgi:hypothetical protein